MEIESSGYLINKILNFANFPVLFYQLSMLSFFFINQRWNDVILILCLFICSVIYVVTNIHTYIFDIYSLHNSLRVYDNNSNGISINEINKWRNKFKHPLVLPIHLEGEEYLKLSSRKFSFEKDNIDSPKKNFKFNQLNFKKSDIILKNNNDIDVNFGNNNINNNDNVKISENIANNISNVNSNFNINFDGNSNDVIKTFENEARININNN
jgi:hypothetical protein